jgi:hypothetical protein
VFGLIATGRDIGQYDQFTDMRIGSMNSDGIDSHFQVPGGLAIFSMAMWLMFAAAPRWAGDDNFAESGRFYYQRIATRRLGLSLRRGYRAVWSRAA